MPYHLAAPPVDGQLFSECWGILDTHARSDLVTGVIPWNAVGQMPVKVKICGITNSDDAAAAVEAGADVLGFMFYELSPRAISIRKAAAIAAGVPAFVLKAGVFVNPSEEAVVMAIRECGLNLLQFHGSEPPEFCLSFGVMSMKAFRMKDAASLLELKKYPTDAWLLDACTPGKLGGTGDRFDWTLAAQAQQLGRPVFLAGGLTPENVTNAIEQAQPYGVDVCSGVEAAPGRKDCLKLQNFVRAAKSCPGPA